MGLIICFMHIFFNLMYRYTHIHTVYIKQAPTEEEPILKGSSQPLTGLGEASEGPWKPLWSSPPGLCLCSLSLTVNGVWSVIKLGVSFPPPLNVCTQQVVSAAIYSAKL